MCQIKVHTMSLIFPGGRWTAIARRSTSACLFVCLLFVCTFLPVTIWWSAGAKVSSTLEVPEKEVRGYAVHVFWSAVRLREFLRSATSASRLICARNVRDVYGFAYRMIRFRVCFYVKCYNSHFYDLDCIVFSRDSRLRQSLNWGESFQRFGCCFSLSTLTFSKNTSVTVLFIEK